MADPVPKKQSSSAKVALYLIIGGVLAMIWSGIWFVAMRNGAVPEWARNIYICSGVFLTGLTLTVIGVLVGKIGQAAKPADTASDKPGAPNPGAGVPAVPVPGVGAAPGVGLPVGAVPAAQQPVVAGR
jgi:hypothetical protein